ncbi:hypothetical protein NQ315_010887 [Exocentrus adspersus]|uniref:C2H2-type domain-containing protein n=1 Tax=Exocentrus adspersus TaxID=1586481 RepID=A0AAV8VPP5_9CUCU|nr:hypothetical protein NQ315_010887 [Exocentrus adspersus]
MMTIRLDDSTGPSKETAKGKEKTVFKCTICPKHFPVPSKLRSHMRTHTGEKPFRCEICNKSFGTAGSLKDHGYLHNKERPFKCTICEKGFTKNSALEDHIRSHTGERPYECNICKKRYRTVVIHQKIHRGEAPYRCKHCGQEFKMVQGYRTHLKHHKNESSNILTNKSAISDRARLHKEEDVTIKTELLE